MKTPALPHQAKELSQHGTDHTRAIWWEMGLGKSWVALAEAEQLFLAGEIDAMLVLAPGGLHRSWCLYEIEPHLSTPYMAWAFDTQRAHTKKGQSEAAALLAYREGLAILTMSYDSIKTAQGKALAKKFLTSRRVFYVADESTRIKTPSALVTRTVLASAKYAPYRRILSGTPVTNSPFDVYSQMKFLDPDFWAKTPYGIGTYGAFKTFFGIWSTGYNGAQGREYRVLVEFKNLDILKQLLAPVATRLKKEDVLNLPEQTYSFAGFDLSPRQRQLYNTLESEFLAFLDGELVTAPLAIVRLLRLQQIVSGYLPIEGEFREIDDKNPRLDLLQEVTEDLGHKAIIWARFVRDIDLICARLGDKCVRWDGTLPMDERETHKRRFLEDDAVQFIVATPASMSEGHTLVPALTSIFYNNSYKLSERLQAEARNHRIGQTQPVHVLDIVANDTLDVKIVEALRKKFDVASSLIDNKFRNWLKSPLTTLPE